MGGAMYAAGRGSSAAQPPRGMPAGWSWFHGRLNGGRQALPPGVRVPIPGATPSLPVQPALERRPPTFGGLDAALGLGLGGGSQAAPTAPAAAGMGIPPGMPSPDVAGPVRPTGGPLMAAMLGGYGSSA